MGTLLVKSRTVMDRYEEQDTTVAKCYAYVEEEAPEAPITPVKVCWLPNALVSDLGYPDQITLTVEPGDKLNGQAAD